MREKREFNFAERWLKLTRPLDTSRPKIALGLAGVLFLVGLASLPWAWEYKLKQEIARVDSQIAALQDIDNMVKKREALRKEVQNQKQILEIVQKNNQDPNLLLDKLRQILPTGTTVNTFALQLDKSLTLGVTVPAPLDAARLWVSLRDSGLFQSVDIQTVSLQDKSQNLNLSLKLK